jgi:hypothetical protein
VAAAPFAAAAQTTALGPTDGGDLPRVAIDRVTVGSTAPDFYCMIQLTEMRGFLDEELKGH